MQAVMLKLKFKGEREYLHGSDLYSHTDEFVKCCWGSQSYVRHMAFRNLTTRQCLLLFVPPSKDQKVIATLSIFTENEIIKSWIVESEELVVERYFFDEPLLLSMAVMDQEDVAISLVRQGEYSVLEEIIALTKLLNNTLDPLKKGKWLFGQLDIDKPLHESCKKIVITRKQYIPQRFSVNSISIDGRNIGKIRFIAGGVH